MDTIKASIKDGELKTSQILKDIKKKAILLNSKIIVIEENKNKIPSKVMN